MIKRIAWALAAGAIALLVWFFVRGGEAPTVPFARATRQAIEATVITNGKIEPAEWIAVRAEREGALGSLRVSKGQHVKKGQPLATFNTRTAESRLASAEARVAQARAEIQTFAAGGRAGELAAIDTSIARTRLDLDQAERDRASLQRLLDRKAATGAEVEEAKKRIEQARLRLDSLARERAALVNPSDRAAAEARLRDAEASVRLARQEIEQAVIRAPMAGTVYQLDVRPGAFVAAGALIAQIGILDRLVATVYVDEPELGRIRRGLPLTLTWDALPGRQWKGSVTRTPTQIVALGTRQVGEVICEIENPDGVLLPGTNVNVSIQTDRSENTVTIPKEAVQKRGQESGVFVLENSRLRWRTVRTGISDITRVEIVEGLKEGESAALPSEVTLREGMKVTPQLP